MCPCRLRGTFWLFELDQPNLQLFFYVAKNVTSAMGRTFHELLPGKLLQGFAQFSKDFQHRVTQCRTITWNGCDRRKV